jgi:hypothetical protein
LSVGKFRQSLQIRDDTRRQFVAKTVPAKVLDNFLTCLRGMGRCFLNRVQSLEEFFRLRSIFFVEVDHVIELLDTAKMALSRDAWCGKLINPRFKMHFSQLFCDVPLENVSVLQKITGDSSKTISDTSKNGLQDILIWT